MLKLSTTQKVKFTIMDFFKNKSKCLFGKHFWVSFYSEHEDDFIACYNCGKRKKSR